MKFGKKKLQELKDNKISIENLNDRYFINSQAKVEADNILKLLNESICSFQEIVDKFKSIKDTYNEPCLWRLLENEKLFKESIKSNRLNKDDLKYLLNEIDNKYGLDSLSENTILLNYIVDNDLFKELVDKFKNIKDSVNDPCLYRLLWNEELFEELIQSNKLNTDDLKYLLNRIDEFYELDELCKSTSLIKYILNEFILNKEDVDRFNEIIEKSYLCKDENIHTIFELIEYHNKNNEEILKLNELNEKVYLSNSLDLNEDQRDKLIEVLKDNEIAQNRLKEIVDNHLESNYDFDSLLAYLKKIEKKSTLNI